MLDLQLIPFPWITEPAIDFLETLPRGLNVLEFGAGCSTVYFTRRGHELLTVEHDRLWMDAVTPWGGQIILAATSSTTYQNAASRAPEDGWDLVLVDGRERVKCALHAADFIKPGGYLMLDNSEREKYRPIILAMRDAGWNEVHAEQNAPHLYFPEKRCPPKWRTSWWRKPRA